MKSDQDHLQSSELNLTPLSFNTPLARLTNQRLNTAEMKRTRLYAKFFHGFHGKNTITSAVDGRSVVIDGQKVLNFGSANYLGMDQHPEVIQASIEALKKWGNHSGCSRIFSSHQNILELEDEISHLVGASNAMIFANVSQTHQGVLPALFGHSDAEIFIDRYAHTSMHQASLVARAKGAKLTRIDVSQLEKTQTLLNSSSRPHKVLLIDGLYSMQGHMPDMVALQEICDRTETTLYIDDAHGIGIFGEHGGGVAEELNLSFDNMILVGSLQKGVGAFGGFVAGHTPLISFLRTSAKPYIFSGTLQPHAVEGARASLRVVQGEEGRQLRAQLRSLSRFVRENLRNQGFEVPTGDSPIVPVTVGSELKTLLSGRRLFDEGVYVNSVLYPAVPKKESLLRISLTTLHSEEEIAALLEAFAQLKVYWSEYKKPFGPNFKYAREILKRQVQRVRDVVL